MSIGISEIIIVILAVVILFGEKTMPELARVLGRALHEFEKAKKTIETEVNTIKKSRPN